MHINYLLIFGATIAQFVLGALWYSPILFGKMWMVIMECTNLPPEELKRMQKEMAPFYGLQLLLTFFTTFSLATLMPYISVFSIYHVAFWIWIGFIAPVQIGAVVWANTKKQYWLKQILIMISFELVALMVASFILSL